MEACTANACRSPFLIAIDSAQALFRPSHYFEPTTTAFLPSYALFVPRLLLGYITGKNPLARGTVLLAASSTPTILQSRAVDFLSVPSRPSQSTPGPFDRIDGAYWDLAKDLQVASVPSMWSRTEAAGLFELLKATRQLRPALSDRTFLEKYIETGGRGADFVRALRGSMSSF
jgi:hypothetical protein